MVYALPSSSCRLPRWWRTFEHDFVSRSATLWTSAQRKRPLKPATGGFAAKSFSSRFPTAASIVSQEPSLIGSQDAPFPSNNSPRVGGVRRQWVCGHGRVGGGLVTEQGPPNSRPESNGSRTRVALS